MKKKKIIVTPNCVFVFIMLMMQATSSSILSESPLYELFTLIGYTIGAFFAMISCITGKVNLPQILKWVAIIALMLVTTLHSMGREFALLVMFWIVLKNQNSDGIVETFLFSNALILVLHLVLSLIGIFPIFDSEHNLSIGFLHKNFVGIYTFNVIQGLLITNKKGKYIFSAVMCMLLWKYVHCRSAALATVILLVLSLFKQLLVHMKLFNIAVKFVYIPFSALSIWAGTEGLANPVLIFFNELLSGRIISWNVYFRYQTIPLLGAHFYASTDGYWALDNAYLWILFRYGLILFIAYGIINFLVGLKAVKYGSKNMEIIILSLAFYSLMEFAPMSVYNNLGLLLLTTHNGNLLKEQINENLCNTL